MSNAALAACARSVVARRRSVRAGSRVPTRVFSSARFCKASGHLSPPGTKKPQQCEPAGTLRPPPPRRVCDLEAATQVKHRELVAIRSYRHHRHVSDEEATAQVERREMRASRSHRHNRYVGNLVAVSQVERRELGAP
eukprot:scaffold98112_cov61-Phaeocystis_antarctica.AAC.3